MKRNLTYFAALAILLAPAPLLAQGGGQRSEQREILQALLTARSLLEQGSVEYLVAKKAELQLSGDQTAKLTAIGSKYAESTKETRTKIRAQLPDVGQLAQRRQRDGNAGNAAAGAELQERLRRLQELAPEAQKLLEEDTKAAAEAMKLLDESQQTKAKSLLEQRLAAVRPRRNGGEDRPANAPRRRGGV